MQPGERRAPTGRGGGALPRAVQKRKGTAGKKKNGRASVKSLIRGCERLLAKDDLQPKARAAQEAKLAKLKAEFEAHKREENERKMALRYHKVKFFERVKAERRVKKMRKGLMQAVLDGVEQIVQELKSELLAAQDQLMYITHFPKGEKYISLFKGEGEQIEAERRRLMEIVKRQQADLAIVTEADEGLGLEVIAGQGAAAPKAPPAAPAQPQGPSTAATIPAEGEVAAAGSAAGRRRKKAAAGGSRAADPHQAAAVAVKKSSRRKKAVDIPGPEASGAPRGGADTKPSAAPQREDPIHGKCGEGRSGKSHAEPEPSAVTAPELLMPGDDVFMPGDDFFMVDDGSAGDLPVPSVVPVPRVATDREELEEKKNRARNTQQRNAFPSGKGQFGASKPKLPGRASKASDKQLRPYGGGVSKRNATTVKHALKIAWQGKGKEGVTKPSAQEKSKQPLRTRAEGGRKRRPKNK